MYTTHVLTMKYTCHFATCVQIYVFVFLHQEHMEKHTSYTVCAHIDGSLHTCTRVMAIHVHNIT